MFNLPPPPQFTLPPPPKFPSDVFDIKILLQLTCSSIQQEQQQQINLHLVIISFIIIIILAIFLTLLFIYIQFYYRRKSFKNKFVSKSITTIPKDISIYRNYSYEAINYNMYLDSINSSETFLSINPNHIIYNQCHQISSHPSYYYTIP
ncbi:unnamed protein product [Rotaria sordida]|uniref:Uncharacterized protein n=1 Tax=Rotaria sordida TaxID=392033 RepID=A0A815FFG4_9BILA|nr:unnamed protein product [Rotaria sordida]CAF1333730.1 unnamed protein product [Rotaria sordida]CAF3780387.1 unnamed protein product [Rotaria sordida]CAF4114377.1 unnamed protein product [Rotaria sordida]